MITITDALAGDALDVSGTLPTTITIFSGAGTASLVLVGAGASTADWEAALALVLFSSASDNPDMYGTDTARTISVTVDDGINSSEAAIATIAIHAVDDNPMLTRFSGDTVTFTEGDPYVLLDQNLPVAIADPDNQNFAGGSFSIGVQINPSAEDELYILNLGPVGTVGNDVYVEGTLIGTITSQGPGQLLTVSFNEDATPDLVAELVDFIAYRNLAGDNPTAGSRSITYLLNDGDGGATAGSVTVDVAAVNDAPGIRITLPGGAPLGGEVKVNSGATGDEGNSSITALPDGGYVVVWWGGPTQGGMNADIYARRFDAAGVAQGADVRVNASSVDDLFNPSVSVLSDGGYVVVWDSYAGVYARRFDASGTAQGNEIRVLTLFNPNELVDADVAGLSGGGFVVTWQVSNKDGSGTAVMAQRYDATGAALGGQVQINSFTSNDQYAPSVTGLSDGSYVVAWTSYQTNGPGAGIYARHYSAAGIAQGIEFLVNTTNAGHQQMPSVSALPGGGFVVAWQSSDVYGGAVHVHAQRFDAANVRQGGEIDVAPASGPTDPTIVGLTGGGFAVTWTSAGDIYARRYDASGAALDLTTLVNGATAGTQHDPSVAALAGGDYIITWNTLVDGGPQPHGIEAQRYGFGYYAVEQFATNLKQSILVSDADARTGTISVTLAVTSGLLAVSAGSSGASVSGGGGSASVTITGTLAQVNALLNTNATSFVLYQNDSDTPPASAELSVTVNDLGNSGSGGSLTTIATETITIRSINDAPSGVDATRTFLEDGSYTLAQADFGFSDLDGNGFAGVKFTSPIGGMLYYDSDGAGGAAPVALSSLPSSTVFSIADIAAGKLTFTPTANLNGTGVASIRFFVSDDGPIGAANQNTDPSSNKLTFNLTAVNDAPSGAELTRTINEDTTYVLKLADFGFSDVDGNAALNVTLTTMPVHGTVFLDADGAGGADPVVLQAGQIVAIADIVAGRVFYTPPLNGNGVSLPGYDRLYFQLQDNGGTANGGVDTDPTPDFLTINVTPVNDPPVLTGSGVNGAFIEGAGPAPIDPGLTFTDVDSSLFSGAVRFSQGTSQGDFLTFANNNASLFGSITGTWNASQLQLNLSGAGTAAQWQNVLRAVSYDTTSDNPSAFARQITFTMSDANGSGPISLVAYVNVTPVNDAPVAHDDAGTTAEDQAITFNQSQLTINDTDGEGESLTVTAVSNAIGGSVTLGAGGRPTFTPNADFNGAASFDYVVTDGHGATGTATVRINVTPVNDAPALAHAIPDQHRTEDVALIYQVPADAFSDVDGDTLGFSATLANGNPLPSWLGFDAATRNFSGTPPQDFNGTLSLKVTASDGSLSVSDIFDLVIDPVNDMPILAQPIPDQHRAEDDAITYQIPAATFADVETATLVYSATLANGDPLPGWLTFTAATRTFSGSPPQDFNGTLSLKVTASDGTLSAADTFDLIIDPVDDAPTLANPIADQHSSEDVAVNYQVPADTFANVDGDTLIFTATLLNGDPLPGWLSFDGATRTFSGTPPQDFNGIISLKVTASDGSFTASDSFFLIVDPVNDAPVVAQAIPDQHGDEDVAVSYHVPAETFTDVEGGMILYAATLANGDPLPAWLSFDANSRTFSGTPPQDFNGTLSLKVAASDGSLSASDFFDLIIDPVNDAPANTVPGSQVVDEDGALSLSGGNAIMVSDADAGGSNLTVTLSAAHGALTLNGIAGLAFSAGDGTADAAMTFSGTALAINAALNGLVYRSTANYNGADAIAVVTTDNGNSGSGGTLQDSDTLAITVTSVNDAPSGTDKIIARNEDAGGYGFTAADFGFSDSDGNGFAGVVISSAVTAGVLVFDPDGPGMLPGVLANPGQFISAAQLANGGLTFLANANGNGSPYASFDFAVRDDGSSANGGQNNDQLPNRITFNLTPVNDAPAVDLNGTGSGTSATLSYAENDPVTPIAAGATLTDVDTTDFNGARLQVEITNGINGEDFLQIVNQGTGTGQIGYASGTITYEGVAIADLLPFPSPAHPILDIAFRSGTITPVAVQALLRAIGYSNSSDDPTISPARSVTFTLNDGDGTANGGVSIGTANATITLTAADDPGVAANDPGNAVNENMTVNIAVLANDNDVDGPAPAVAKVDGNVIAVGAPVTLASGAKVSLNSDGTLTYDPNGQFNALTSAGTGAANTSKLDSFTYTLAGGGTATVSVTVNGVASAQDHLEGDAGNNIVTGTGNGDFFDLSQGGNDVANGGGGNDAFFFGGAFTGADRVDGGAGTNDQIGLQGDYAGANALVLGPNTIANIEAIVVLPGFSYDITTVDGNVAAGGVLKIQATLLTAGQNLIFNGSAETDGSLVVYGGQGNDSMTGGGGNDGFYFGPGGFNGSDVVNGGAGTNDQLALDGDYTLTLGGNVTNVEVLVMLHGPTGTPNHFNITSGDVFVGAGQTKIIFGLQVETPIMFDGSGEHDGAFRIYGGMAGDTLTGGTGNDWIFGSSGGDLLTGGPGSDTYYYDNASQSTSRGFDTIFGFDDSADTIDLPFALSGLAGPASGNLSNGTFDADLSTAFAGLTSHQAGMFTATGGDMAGRTFLVIDADGNAGYQAGSDYVIEIVSPVTPIDSPAIFV